MTTATKQDAPGVTGQQEPATTIDGWAICTLEGLPVRYSPNDWGDCIDIACDRLGAQNMLAQHLETNNDVPVELRRVRMEVVRASAAPGQLFALRKPDGDWCSFDSYETGDFSLKQVETFTSADQAAAARHYNGQPDLEIVPLAEAK